MDALYTREMNERGHYGLLRVGQDPARYMLDPEYRHSEQERLHRDIGDKGISTQGMVILGVAAALIIGIGVIGKKRGIRFSE